MVAILAVREVIYMDLHIAANDLLSLSTDAGLRVMLVGTRMLKTACKAFKHIGVFALVGEVKLQELQADIQYTIKLRKDRKSADGNVSSDLEVVTEAQEVPQTLIKGKGDTPEEHPGEAHTGKEQSTRSLSQNSVVNGYDNSGPMLIESK